MAAVVLGLLGVPDETIVADYTKSAPAMRRLVAHLERAHPEAAAQVAAVAPALIAADAETMETFLNSVRKNYGGFEGLAEAFDVGSAAPYLRDQLLR